MKKNFNYNLFENDASDTPQQKGYLATTLKSVKEFGAYMGADIPKLPIAFLFILLNSAAGVITPYYIARAIDTYIAAGDASGLGQIMLILAGLFLVTVVAGYYQGKLMGDIAQRTLARLRAAIFGKLQELPIAFFNQNRAGDLMSRINNDTDKLSQFFSESIVRLAGSLFVVVGIGVFIFFLNWKLALVLLSSTIIILIVTRIVSPIIERENGKSLASIGALSSAIQESISNFKVVVAFNRRGYFERSIADANRVTYKATIRAGLVNHILEPIYDFSGNIAQLVVLIFGFMLIVQGEITIGVLIAFLGYAQRFYDPLRVLATIFGNIQVSLASWDRIRRILHLDSNLDSIEANAGMQSAVGADDVLEFKDVSFSYPTGKVVLENVSLKLEQGKTYALVGPTGGGKTTISNLMARLYDPTSGQVLFKGKDMREYTEEDRGHDIGVILQEPFLFTGSVAENIIYGNNHLKHLADKGMGAGEAGLVELESILTAKGFSHLLERFSDGLAMAVQSGGENISLGQKQLVSFMRILLREPELLILDEATANIDTVTERILSDIVDHLPASTTKVIIAHRLTTIKRADAIIFVHGGAAQAAMDFDHAVDLIKGSRRQS